MSSLIIVRVIVPLLLLNLFASAQMYGYPTQYSQPYPYMQQYPSYGGDVNNFGAQGYMQVHPQSYPYPYQPVYPGVPSYAPQYPSYPSYPSYPGSVSQGSYPDQTQYPSASYPGSVPQGSYPDQSQYPSASYPGSVPQGGYPDQSQYPMSGLPPQYPPGTNIYPANYPVPTPKMISTPYGNIPVEIIDVDDPIQRQVDITGAGFNTTEEKDNTKLMPILTESKSVFDVLSNPSKSTKYVKTEPTQTKIVRTLDPKAGKIHVEVQTNSPPQSKENEISNEENNEEDNDTTTRKWSVFG